MSRNDTPRARLESHRHERAALGICLVEPRAVPIFLRLTPQHFSIAEARHCFEEVVRLNAANLTPTVTTLADHLERCGFPDGRRFTAALVEDNPDPTEAEEVVDVLEDRYRARQLDDYARWLQRQLRQDRRPAAQLYTLAVERLNAQESRLNGACRLDLQAEVAEARLALENGTASQPGLSTGFPSLDRRLRVLPGQLGILEGRTGEGKSAMAGQMALAFAGAGCRVAWWSGEMTRLEIVWRAVAQLSGWPEERCRRGDSAADVSLAFDRLGKLPWQIEDSIPADCSAVLAWASRIHSFAGSMEVAAPFVLVVDFLQMMLSAGDPEYHSSALEGMARRFKGWAMAKGAFCLLLSQMTDPQPGATPRAPVLGQTRGSRGIEHAADWVVAPFRPERISSERTEEDTQAQVHILKQRGGWTGKLAGFTWDGPTYRYLDPLSPESVVHPSLLAHP